MKPFTVAELQQLLVAPSAPCISLFQPTHRLPQQTREDAIRFKNLVGEAERLLSAALPTREVRALLEPLSGVMDEEPRGARADGLAVFRSREVLEVYSVPFDLPERVVVADAFHVRPLIRYLQSSARYYVLSLSRNAVALYEGNEHGLSAVPAAGLPASLADALQTGDVATFTNRHSGGAGVGAASFHGSGSGEEDRKEELEPFFRAVDEALWEILRDEHVPLLLAGVGYYHPIYREVSRYTHLLHDGVEGNFERATPAELHERAWPIVREHLRRREVRAVDEANGLRGRGLSSDDLDTVARAAVQGRVRRLLLARGRHVWGRFDRVTGDVELHESQQDSHDDDVLDEVAQAVLSRGGEVLLLEPERLTNGTKVAAVLRW
jgi:hypothetical protein